MSSKKLIILLVIFGVFIIVAGISKLMEPSTHDIIEEAGIIDLAGSDFLMADVGWFEVWRAGKESEKVTLQRAGDAWLLASRFAAPADREKVKGFLALVKDLRGESISDEESVLADYGLKDNVLHLKVVKKEGQGEPMELLIGKGSKFARKVGSNTVYSISKDLYKELGLYGEDNTDAPKSAEWLAKKIVEADKEKITKISLTYPDKELVLEKVEKAQPEADKKEGEEAKPEPAETKKEFEWKIVSGGWEGLKAARQPADRILNRLASLEATDVADPARKAEWGLDKPGYLLKAELEDGKIIEIQGSFPPEGTDAYIITSESGGHIYTLREWGFTNLFPKGNSLYENLPGTDIKKDAIKAIELTNLKGESLTVKKEGETLSITVPDIALKAKDSELTSILNGIENLKTEDFSDRKPEDDIVGLKTPEARIKIITEDGDREILIGKPNALVKGRYIKFSWDEHVYGVPKHRLDRMFPELDSLFEKELTKIENAAVKGITIAIGKDSLMLVRTEEGWQGKEVSDEFTADKAAIDEYLKAFQPLTVNGVALKEAEEMLGTVSLAMEDGKTRVFGMKKGPDSHTLTVNDLAGVFTIDETIFNKLAASFIRFRKAEAPLINLPGAIPTPKPAETPAEKHDHDHGDH